MRWLGLLLAAACAPAGGPTLATSTGGLLVEWSFGTPRGVPGDIGRLQLSILDVAGSTLTETNLHLDPVPPQLALIPGADSWALDGLAPGRDRLVLAKAYFGAADASLAGRVAYTARAEGVEVPAGRRGASGTLRFAYVGPRIVSRDHAPPEPPSGLELSAVPSGGALAARFFPPAGGEDGGYLVLVATSSTVRKIPALERGARLALGARVEGLAVVAADVWAGRAEVSIPNLRDGLTYAVLIYAHDTDAEGRPLNYSAPATALGVPRDRVPPGPCAELSVTATAAVHVNIAFLAAADATRYEVRAARRAEEIDEAGFDDLLYVAPPPVAESMVRFARSFEALGARATEPFFVAVRAVDGAQNRGPIAIAQYLPLSMPVPIVSAMAPGLALAGGELTLSGRAFGRSGRARLTTTGTSADTFELAVLSWSDRRVDLRVPRDARSGVLTLIPTEGGGLAELPLPVIARIPEELFRRCARRACFSGDDGPYAYAMAGASALDGSTTGAVYRECCLEPGFEGLVERLHGLANENLPHAAGTSAQRSSAVAATHSLEQGRFLFVAANRRESMSTILLSTDRAESSAVRVELGVQAGSPDRVSIAALPAPRTGPLPAMLAFSSAGVIRTATVADVARQPFAAFFADRPAAGGYDRVTIARKSDGELGMAHRIVAGADARLAVARNRQGRDPAQFVRVDAQERPRSGPGIEVLAVPESPSGAERFAVAYEAIEPDGRVEIRMLGFEDYGAGPGYAPLPATSADRRLADAGLVMRDGVAWIALLVEEPRLSRSKALIYTEVPQAALRDRAAAPGAFPGVVLDIALADASGRLGCKPYPQNTCPIGWYGKDTELLFVRR